METMFSGLLDVVEDRPKEKKHLHSFTLYADTTFETKYEGMASRLISPVAVGDIREKNVVSGVNALWDTGAVTSGISRALASKLNLWEIARKTCIMPGGQLETPVYRINLVLWGNMEFKDIEVTEYPLENHDCDLLIGMDIISKGKLVVDSTGGRTTVSFTM